MNERKRRLSRRLFLAAGLFVIVASITVVRTTGQDGAGVAANEQWEYLALAGPATTNLTPTGNPRMRK